MLIVAEEGAHRRVRFEDVTVVELGDLLASGLVAMRGAFLAPFEAEGFGT